jgi:hypothetical protein
MNAGLAGRDTACAEGAADFGCLVGGGGEMMTTKKPGAAQVCPDFSARPKYLIGIKERL